MVTDRHRWLPPLGLALLAAVPVIAVLTDDPYLVTIFTRVVVFALAATSLDFILGYGALVSFGHAAFVGAGAYTVGILAHHAHNGTALIAGLPWLSGTTAALLAWPVAVAVAAMLALLIGALSLRTRNLYFIMITLAFAQVIFFLFTSLERYGGDDGLVIWSRNTLPLVDTSNPTQFYYLCLAFLAGTVYLLRRVVAARFGRVLRGAAENERRMQALGFPVYRYRLAAFTIAGGLGGLAGALLANLNTFVSPGLLHWSQSGELMIMVILGGIGTLNGPVVGAAALILLEETLATWTDHWMIVLGPILVAVVLFARRG
ncbi:MAG: branched-chain amino acid ABC transporter permease, partial [Halofilum sp. (in: g-proteobacteria)]|nr:branched-chain amino acid ABC transporter permease [Halofilum sp. (in: g-proteobacteria)]